ncbi:MAG: OB-fold putative lipoprotein [Acidobacteria bacterium]|nr:OB-fold putative lipoprotein [Acidobacteriota bacterium]
MHIEPFSLCVNNRNLRKSFFPACEWIRIACSIVLTVAALSCNSSSPREPSRRAGEGSSVSILSANRLYREFNDNPIDATAKYQGKTVALEGLVGQIIRLEHGEAAVHLADDGNRIAIATFPRQDDLRGVHAGDKIQLQCAFDKYEFKTVWLSFCTLAPPQNIGPEPAIGASNVPSANLLYREYVANAKAASAKHDGTIVEMEARLGDLIQLSSGGVAIHIADGGKRNALVATFPDASAVAGIEQGELFRLRCRVEKFEYFTIWLEACQIAH